MTLNTTPATPATPATPRTWFVTGTSSGFGRNLTELLLEKGERVAATARKTESLDDLKAGYGEMLWVKSLDVTDTDAVRRVVNAAFADLSRIEVVVNNAGYSLFGAAEEVSDAQIVQQLNTNLVGSIQVIRAALPHLRNQGGGRILQVSSMGGQITAPNFSLYHATKWGIEGFVEAVAQEAAPFGIEFTIFEPGGFKTAFVSNLVRASAMEVYENSVTGEVRRALTSGASPQPGDPRKMAQAMIDSVGVKPAPRRLALGSDAYARIHETLTQRLAALENQKQVAVSTDSTE